MTDFEKHILRLLIVLIKQSGKIGIGDAYYVLTLEKELQENDRE